MGKKSIKTQKSSQPPKKRIPQNDASAQKKPILQEGPTDDQLQLWCLKKIDRNGKFGFDVNKEDFEHKRLVEIIIDYTGKTWSEIKSEKHHARGRTCHHELSPESLSKDAKSRILAMGLDEYADSLFSMKISSIIRIIGYREGQVFNAVWYDPKHEFCPSTR